MLTAVLPILVLPENGCAIAKDAGRSHAFLLTLQNVFSFCFFACAIGAIGYYDNVNRDALFNVAHNGSAATEYFIIGMRGKYNCAITRDFSNSMVGNECVFQCFSLKILTVDDRSGSQVVRIFVS